MAGTANATRRRNTTIDDIWADLEEGLTSIYDRKPMDPTRYMQLYTYVYDFCTTVAVPTAPNTSAALPGQARNAVNSLSRNNGRQRQPQPQPGNRQGNGAGTNYGPPGADFVGMELYKKLEEFISNHATSILQRGLELMGEDLLRYFTTAWDQFRFCSKVVDGIFAYLNRHWIRRELEEGRQNIYVVYTMALVTWKTILYDHMSSSVAAGVLDLIEKERNGIAITTQLVKGVVDCFVELGVDEVVDPQAGDNAAKNASPKLRVYKKFLEDKFLDATELYYAREAETFLRANSCTEYMKRVERRLEEERVRCEMYLNSSTQNPLAHQCEKVLITRQLELFQSEFCNLLENQRDEDLGRMYKLCERVEGGLEELKSALEKHIRKQGLEAVEQVAAQAASDAKVFVHTLLRVHNRYSGLVSGAFQNESGFVQSLDKAATHFINKNAVTQSDGGNSNKCPELLARYCDQLLRKSSRNTEDSEMDDQLTQVMIIFKYVEDKDVFQRFYTKMFAKRLVGDLSSSDEAESSMIAKLKQMCGFEYTNKMQRMFTDTGLSKEMSSDFREFCNNKAQKLGCDFNVMVLGANSWPSQQPMPIAISPVLSNCVEKFTAFYNNLHQGRKLSWVYGQSRGELTSFVWSKRYSFTALTAQITVLLQFNEAIEHTVGEMVSETSMKREQLLPIIQSLTKADLIKTDGEIGPNTPDTVQLKLNMEYASKKLKVDLSKNVMRSESKQESNEVQQNVDDNRKMIIQACIVRIMKTRKRMQHQQLLTEVIGQLNSRFKPKIPMVKKCIDVLIEKEYLQRVDGERDTYEYLT